MTETRRSSVADEDHASIRDELKMPMPWLAFGVCSRAAEPAARNAARLNLELSCLMGQRARAYADIPQILSHCRNPVDLVQAQMAFWQEAGRHYAEAAERVASVWQAALSVPSAAAVFGGDAEQRDFITFPEGKADITGNDRNQSGSKRRAA